MFNSAGGLGYGKETARADEAKVVKEFFENCNCRANTAGRAVGRCASKPPSATTFASVNMMPHSCFWESVLGFLMHYPVDRTRSERIKWACKIRPIYTRYEGSDLVSIQTIAPTSTHMRRHTMTGRPLALCTSKFYHGCRSHTCAQTRASTVLRRRTASVNASVRGLPTLRGGRLELGPTLSVLGQDNLRGMPSAARVCVRSSGFRPLRAEVGRGGGGGGSGDAVTDAAESPEGSSGKKSPFWRLLDEARQEMGHHGMAAVCLLISSSMNLMAPTVLARVIDRASKKGGRGSSSKGSPSTCSALQSIPDSTFFLGALGVFAVGSLASWGRVYALAMASAGVASRLRAKLFEALMLQEKAFFDKEEPGTLTPVLVEDVDTSSKVFSDKAANLLRSMNSSINASLALLSISPSLTLVSISTVPIVGAVSMLYSGQVRKLTAKLRDMDSEAHAFAQARLANIRTVRCFANETTEAERFRQMVDQSSMLRAKEAGSKGLFRGGLFVMSGASLIAVFWAGGSRVGEGKMTSGQLTSFAVYTGMVGLGFSGLASAYADITRSLTSTARVFALIDRQPAVPINEGKIPGNRAVGEMEFRDVWFTYPGRDKLVLQGVDLRLSKGKVLALTGASGAGKSTLAALLSRLYEPDAGCIVLDGVDVATLNPSWLRQQVGVVDQEPVLFAGTIADNIRYGVPLASDDDVQDAARQANAHDFIMEFPQGYATKVGDQGRQLSGGEKQRVAIARAVLKNPPVLVLDEATSALDAESERLVSEAVDRLVVHRTVLVIAHRQSTVKKADYIAVLEDGRVAESGTYEELMASSSGVFSKLMEGVNDK